jgi:hypothetical protein
MDLKINTTGVGLVADTLKKTVKSTGIHEQLRNYKPLKSKYTAFI